MKRTLASAFACVCVLAGTSAWGQPPSDCRPSALNIPGAPYPCVYPDNRVMFRVVAPEAHKVRVRLGPGFDMAKEPDGLWYVTTTPQVVGFHSPAPVLDVRGVPVPAPDPMTINVNRLFPTG